MLANADMDLFNDSLHNFKSDDEDTAYLLNEEVNKKKDKGKVPDLEKDYIDPVNGEDWEQKIEKHAMLEVALGKI
jgi:hypothetical protein